LTSCTALGLAGVLSLSGCGSEPSGDAAYGQKFEKPAGAPEPTGEMPDSGSTRREEIKKAKEAAANKSTSKRR